MPLSKTRVTMAGERLRAHRLGTALLDSRAYVRERAVVEEFRAGHAVSLTRVAANLRYYVQGEADGGPWTVGQRLKAMPTILDKLVRHPKMELLRLQEQGELSDVDFIKRVSELATPPHDGRPR